MHNPSNRDIQTLVEIMSTLRDPLRGCPWDRDQSFASIAPYTIEEAYEVVDAIQRNNLPNLCDELGDLLLQVVFHAQMASEIQAFDFGDVVAAITTKMQRRHPHVFGEDQVTPATALGPAWETLKAAEREAAGDDPSAIGGVCLALPALTRATKLGQRAARVGLDWPDLSGVVDKVREELEEVLVAHALGQPQAINEELGDLLLACTSLARHCRVDPEQALRQACAKFEGRFRQVEAGVQAAGKAWEALSATDLDGFWQRAKAGG